MDEPLLDEIPEAQCLHAGDKVSDFRVIRLVGKGGMGAVYLAEHEEIGYRAAVKTMVAYRAEHSHRLVNEARAVNRVSHPGVVKIFGYGHLPDQHKTPYLIMEYLEGDLLSQRLKGMAPSNALRIARQIASVLFAAHERGVVHRDLKPSNVMLVNDPDLPEGERVRLLDFGVAKMVGPMDSGAATRIRTKNGMVLGTALYIAPEQCRGLKEVDGKADVYSLGVMLYQMLAGRTPFVADSEGELVTMHLRDEPPDLSALAPGLSHATIAMVHAMLRKDPNARPDMGTVRDELCAWPEDDSLDVVAHKSKMSRVPSRLLPSAISPALTPPPPGVAPVPRVPRMLGILALSVGLVGALSLLFLQEQQDRKETLQSAAGRGDAGVEAPSPFTKLESGTRYHLRAILHVPEPGKAGELWIGGDGGILLHGDPEKGQFAPVPSGTTESIRAFYSVSSQEIFAVGGHGLALRWNGTAWSTVDSKTTVDLRGVHGTGSKDIWAVGKQGRILHWDGKEFSKVPSGVTEDLRGIWGFAGVETETWAIGEYGVLLRWTGTAWSRQKIDTKSWLARGWGESPTDLWVVGNESTIAHWNGSVWELADLRVRTEMSDIWGRKDKDVWAVGNDGMMLRFDGKRWVRVPSGTNNWLYGVFAGESGVWAVGAYGTILRAKL